MAVERASPIGNSSLGNQPRVRRYRMDIYIYSQGHSCTTARETVELPNSHEGDVGATGITLVVGVNEAQADEIRSTEITTHGGVSGCAYVIWGWYGVIT